MDKGLPCSPKLVKNKKVTFETVSPVAQVKELFSSMEVVKSWLMVVD